MASGPTPKVLKDDDLADSFGAREPIESFVEFIQAQPVREELVDRESAGSELTDQLRYVALGNARAEVRTFQGALFSHE